MTQVVLSILKPVGSVGTTVQLAIVPPEFVAIKTDGSITAWGQNYGGTGAAPSTGTYTKIYTTAHAFAALKADGSITADAVE
jgi:phosphotransferase system IIA component